jgi:hypothetical protein
MRSTQTHNDKPVYVLLPQDPTKRQEVHDQLAAVTHKLLISATAPGSAPTAEAAAEAPAGAPEVCNFLKNSV